MASQSFACADTQQLFRTGDNRRWADPRTAITAGRRDVTPDTALRLARYLGTTPEFWLNLQFSHDLSAARAAAGERIEHEVMPRAA